MQMKKKTTQRAIACQADGHCGKSRVATLRNLLVALLDRGANLEAERNEDGTSIESSKLEIFKHCRSEIIEDVVSHDDVAYSLREF